MSETKQVEFIMEGVAMLVRNVTQVLHWSGEPADECEVIQLIHDLREFDGNSDTKWWDMGEFGRRLKLVGDRMDRTDMERRVAEMFDYFFNYYPRRPSHVKELLCEAAIGAMMGVRDAKAKSVF
jgi:hypothetical protein